ncbi:Alpha N-terminal protein methyltransferase 1 [Diplonema papillatum]|nr:Alpha N-terminal protein methyltransferase 1 [Diplonema papillatum]
MQTVVVTGLSKKTAVAGLLDVRHKDKGHRGQEASEVVYNYAPDGGEALDLASGVPQRRLPRCGCCVEPGCLDALLTDDGLGCGKKRRIVLTNPVVDVAQLIETNRVLFSSPETLIVNTVAARDVLECLWCGATVEEWLGPKIKCDGDDEVDCRLFASIIHEHIQLAQIVHVHGLDELCGEKTRSLVLDIVRSLNHHAPVIGGGQVADVWEFAGPVYGCAELVVQTSVLHLLRASAAQPQPAQPPHRKKRRKSNSAPQQAPAPPPAAAAPGTVAGWVYRRRLPFNAAKLHRLCTGEDSPLRSVPCVVHLEGTLWVFGDPKYSYEAKAYGATPVSVQKGTAWWASVPVVEWPVRIYSGIANDCDGKDMDRRQEIVVCTADKTALPDGGQTAREFVEGLLDECLVKDYDFEACRGSREKEREAMDEAEKTALKRLRDPDGEAGKAKKRAKQREEDEESEEGEEDEEDGEDETKEDGEGGDGGSDTSDTLFLASSTSSSFYEENETFFNDAAEPALLLDNDHPNDPYPVLYVPTVDAPAVPGGSSPKGKKPRRRKRKQVAAAGCAGEGGARPEERRSFTAAWLRAQEDKGLAASKDAWYGRGRAYWQGLVVSLRGVELDGMHWYDVRHSRQFFDRFRLHGAMALDLAGGIGRFVDGVLADRYASVHLVEGASQLAAAAKRGLTRARFQYRRCTAVSVEQAQLQSWEPSYALRAAVDLVAITWVLMFFTDDDVLALLRKARSCLRPGGGVIYCKENTVEGLLAVNTTNSSTNRSPQHLRLLFDAAGLAVQHEEFMQDVPPNVHQPIAFLLKAKS